MNGETRRSPNASGHLIVGLIFIGLGVVFLMTRMSPAFGLSLVFRYWPLIPIVVGILKLVQARDVSGRVGGVFWILMGALFLAGKSGYIWPAGLIFFGLFMIWRSRQVSTISADSLSTVGAMAFMGGFERRCNSQDFQGGEITAVMGGCKLDLREAAISGEQATLNVFLWMGGLELTIPENWVVTSKVIPIMGGVGDRTRPPRDNPKRLVIEGILLMGGIEVKN